jgi:hypothetical protein
METSENHIIHVTPLHQGFDNLFTSSIKLTSGEAGHGKWSYYANKRTLR